MKNGLDRARNAVITQITCLETLAQAKTQGVDEDGFSGPCLAGQDIKPGGQFERNLFDDAEILYRQGLKHGGNTKKTEKGHSLFT